MFDAVDFKILPDNKAANFGALSNSRVALWKKIQALRHPNYMLTQKPRCFWIMDGNAPHSPAQVLNE
jgi:hypothetical protein